MFSFGIDCALALSIATAEPGGDGDLTDQLGEQGATFLVGGCLVVLDLLPFGMAGHAQS
jgi:hypothetical protein